MLEKKKNHKIISTETEKNNITQTTIPIYDQEKTPQKTRN